MTKSFKVSAYSKVPVTIVLSCVLLGLLFYSLHSTSVLSSDNAKDLFLLNRFKRKTGTPNSFRYYDYCITAKPSKRDIQKLCKHQHCTSVHCVRTPSCDGAHQTRATTTCFSKVCSKYAWNHNVSGNQHSKEKASISLSELSYIVNDHLDNEENTETFRVKCTDENSHLFNKEMDLELTTEMSVTCTTVDEMVSNGTEGKKQPQNHTSIPHVHVLYFRFLSKWESYIKLARLNAFIEHKRNDSEWNVHSFNKMQSQNHILSENLRLLLRGSKASPGIVNTTREDGMSLLSLAISQGRCVIFDAIACHKSNIFDKIIKVVSSDENSQNCQFLAGKHITQMSTKEHGNRTFCSNAEDELDNLEDELYIHDRLNSPLVSANLSIFSLSIVNIPDLPSTYTFDASITKVVSKILADQSNALILVSDIGEPKFLRLDESVFLRTQTFNPLLHVIVPKSSDPNHGSLFTENPNPKISDGNFHLMALSDVFSLTETLLSSGQEMWGDNIDVEDELINNRSHGNHRDETRSRTSCPAEEIKGPVECLCLGNHVRFPNDSIQVAFATFVVGSLNNRLLDLSSLGNEDMRNVMSGRTDSKKNVKKALKVHNKCDRMVGISFQNIQHVLWKNSTFVLMNLQLQQSTRNYSDILSVNAEVEYTTDDNYNTKFDVNVLYPTKINIDVMNNSKNPLSRRLTHLLCQEPDDLSEINIGEKEFLKHLSFGRYFGGKPTVKSIHHPCLFIITTAFPDTAVIEAANLCSDRSYSITIGVELLNVISFSALPVEVELTPRDLRYITSLVKSAYGLMKSTYKLKTFYTVDMF